jgi:phage shock protein PspC (stress-responsive transcriptional regulator)
MLGVCSGFARWADVDPTLTRLTMVLLTVFLGPITILAYVVTAMVASNR